MTDLFDEVEGQLRADQLRRAATKAAPWVLGLAILIIIAVFSVYGWRRHEQQAMAKASEVYGQGLDALVQGRTDEAFRLFGDVAGMDAKAYKSLALMQQGGLRLANGKTKEAAALFDQAATAAPDELIGDAARLKSAFAVMDTAPYKEMETRLQPLTASERPYHVQAREALAFAKLAAGDLAGARGDFVVISLLPDAPESAQGRAEAAKQLIDSGSAKSVPAVIKAAAIPLPPMVAPEGPASPPAAAPQPPASGPQ